MMSPNRLLRTNLMHDLTAETFSVEIGHCLQNIMEPQTLYFPNFSPKFVSFMTLFKLCHIHLCRFFCFYNILTSCFPTVSYTTIGSQPMTYCWTVPGRQIINSSSGQLIPHRSPTYYSSITVK
jgi:hypothetical protein